MLIVFLLMVIEEKDFILPGLTLVTGGPVVYIVALLK